MLRESGPVQRVFLHRQFSIVFVPGTPADPSSATLGSMWFSTLYSRTFAARSLAEGWDGPGI